MVITEILKKQKTNTKRSFETYSQPKVAVRVRRERKKDAKLELKLKWREGDAGGDLQQ